MGYGYGTHCKSRGPFLFGARQQTLEVTQHRTLLAVCETLCLRSLHHSSAWRELPERFWISVRLDKWFGTGRSISFIKEQYQPIILSVAPCCVVQHTKNNNLAPKKATQKTKNKQYNNTWTQEKKDWLVYVWQRRNPQCIGPTLFSGFSSTQTHSSTHRPKHPF